MLTHYERGFLEAAIDADGCIGIWRRKQKDEYHKRRLKSLYRPYVRVTNTNLAFLQKIKSICGDQGFIVNYKATQPNWNDGHHYTMPIKLITRILPELKLTIKERQRLLLLEFLNLRETNCTLAELHRIWLQMKELNKKGRNSPSESKAGLHSVSPKAGQPGLAGGQEKNGSRS